MDFEGAFFETDDYIQTERELGKGSYGQVFLVKNKKDGSLYAAKIINFQNEFTGKQQNSLMRELAIQKRLNHPAIVKFYGINFHSFDDATTLSPTILTEYLPNGSLRKILKKEQQGLAEHDWTATKKYICLIGIASAMKYLHKHGILHRDLKPENILIDENFYPCVCDFGLSRCFNGALTKSMKLSMTGKVGTPLYMAPELFEDDQHFGTGIDVYSFAIIAYEIASGIEPYSDEGKSINCFNLVKKVTDGKRPKFVDGMTKKMKKLLNKCWSYDVEDRLSFDEIFNELSNDFTYLNEDEDEEEINEYLAYLEEGTKDDDIQGKKEDKNEKNVTKKNEVQENEIKCHVEMIQEMIKNNDNIQKVKIQSVDGNILHLACKSGNLELVKSIIALDQLDIKSRSVFNLIFNGVLLNFIFIQLQFFFMEFLIYVCLLYNFESSM